MNSACFRLDNQLVLITGAGQGLGNAIAWACAANGAHVILNGRSEAILLSEQRRFEEQGFKASVFVQDITDYKSYAHNFNILCKEIGIPSIHINCVGQRLRSGFNDCEPEAIVQHIHTNLSSTVLISRLAAKTMQEAKMKGRIISLSSIAGRIARYGDSIYPIAKQGIEAMVRALAVEYGPVGITSNGIAPGTFATESNRELARDPIKGPLVLGRNPLQRWADPQEIGGVAVFLASTAASYINGHVLVVDGGFSIAF